jgi:hypothetical protein
MQQARETVTGGTNTGGVARTPRESSELSLLIDVHSVAALLTCSARHVWRLADAGKRRKRGQNYFICFVNQML